MKKSSKAVQLVLITSLLASCNKPNPAPETLGQKVYMRADSTAQYTDVTQQYSQQRTGGMGMGNALLWYMAFRHLGGGMGYGAQGIHPSSVSGTNASKAKAFEGAKRGGFGNTAKTKETSASS
ncbi:hypothetical protein K5I29_05140 [Flavobacterium agricola]|uniref:Uncharacterized protein n=1 Tax=Flavobacterium agricola TaxID=2870839 RepID=A0ABY6M4W6_9FLAO|nr:hypothetical protein [Flavobacterium agricola]UYW02288.1 hypothetical protein K5I29_05140 [Flavobacterium agricola]